MLKDTIVFYRKQNGLSQEELANRLLVSRQTVSQWETGQTLPTIDNLQRLKEIFGVGLDVLLDESASSAAEEAEPTGAEQPAPQPAAQPAPQPVEAGAPYRPYAQPPAFQENTAPERFSYTLSEQEIKRGIRNGWAASLRGPMLLLLVPLIFSFSDEDGSMLVGMVFWMLAVFVLCTVRWRKRRKKLLEMLGSRRTEILVYADHLTQNTIADGETVSMSQMKFSEIRRADDLGTLFRVTDGERVLLLPKNVVPAGGILHRQLTDTARASRERINPAVTAILIIGTVLVIGLVSQIYLSLVGSDGSFENAQAHAWVWLFALPFPLACVGYGIAKTCKKTKGSVKFIIIGAFGLLFVCTQMLLPVISGKMNAGMAAAVAQVEEDAKITLPEHKSIQFRKNMTLTGAKRVTETILMTMERSVSLAFDKEVEKDARWIPAAQAERLSPVWNPQQSAQEADYVMCVNLTDGTVNELPGGDGTYKFINLLYMRESATLFIVRYEVDYLQ